MNILFLGTFFAGVGAILTPLWQHFLQLRYGEKGLKKRPLLSWSAPMALVLFGLVGYALQAKKESIAEDREEQRSEQEVGALTSSGTILHPAGLETRTVDKPVSVLFGSNTFRVSEGRAMGLAHWEGDSLITFKSFGGRVYISATIYDRDKKICGIVSDNKFVVDWRPGVRAYQKPSSLVVVGASGEKLLDITLLSYTEASIAGVVYGPNGAKVADTSSGGIGVWSNAAGGIGRRERPAAPAPRP